MPDEIKSADRQIEKMREVLRGLRDKFKADGEYDEAAALDVIMADDEHVLRLTAIVVPKN